MRVLFSGDRRWHDTDAVLVDLHNIHRDAVIVVGDCPTGVDAIVRKFAQDAGHGVEVHHAMWEKHGKAAGPIRNQAMIDTGIDHGYFYITPQSRGTRHCLNAATRAGVPVNVRQENT